MVMEEIDTQDATGDVAVEASKPQDTPQREDVRALVARIGKEIKADKEHHSKAFKRMRRDQRVATWGRDKDWPEANYTANIIGRFVKMKTAALYAKNPKIVAKRRDTLDFVMWDESPGPVEQALQLIQTQAQLPPQQGIDPFTGLDTITPPPELPGFQEAQALMKDIAEGMQRRQQMKRIGKTLELLMAHFMREQMPLDFKAAMKKVARRASTTGVGYVEIGFQRENGPRPDTADALADARGRLDHMRSLAEQVANNEIDGEDSKIAELEMSVQELQNTPEVVLREGLVFDYPTSTSVIPDRLCRSLMGFIGARHVTVEMKFTKTQVREMFGVDLGKEGRVYTVNGDPAEGDEGQSDLFGSDTDALNQVVCVWKHYDKTSGLCYYLCEGYDRFLREPAAPDVFVEDFWPIYALTFNDVENEEELFPPSDVSLLLHQQREYNRARQGQREHREAARPRWATGKGALDEADANALSEAKAFSVTPLNLPPGAKIGDILQPIPVPGVDPNLYETGQIFTDAQLVGGMQEAALGGVAKGTATETQFAAESASMADASSIDDLDSFLTRVSRGAGQILMREMSPEKVTEIVGPGALWPEMTLETIVNELFLEVEAGSTGKPNAAQEIRNWRELLPFLLQMPNMQPMWLLRETLRRLDDRMDLTEALAEGIPSIMSQNRMAQVSQGDPNAAPDQQGDKGAGNAPAPPGGPAGSSAPMGDNKDPVRGPGSTGALAMM